MDWIKLFEKKKELSSLQLEKSDITYQVWELGNLLSHLSGYYSRILTFPGNKIDEEELFGRIKTSRTLQDSYIHLSNKLSSGSLKVLSDQSENFALIYEYFKNLKKADAIEAVDLIRDKIVGWHRKILNELRAHSIHLANIYLFSFTLETLREKLAYEIESLDLEPLIDECIRNLNNLEKGDKILTSPSLKLTERNLLILKYRLNEVRSHISDLKELSEKNKDKFSDMIKERAVLMEYLILDLRNPQDYMTAGRKMLNNFIPFIVIYYLAAIPILLFSEMTSKFDLEIIKIAPFISGFIPLYIYVLWKLFGFIKNKMIIHSFKLNIDRFS